MKYLALFLLSVVPAFAGTKADLALKAALSSGGGGKIVQWVYTDDDAVATGNTGVPVDNTIPQNTEGVEYMSLSITPTDSANKLIIYFNGYMTSNNSVSPLVVSLFQDSTSDALATRSHSSSGTFVMNPDLLHVMTAGTTSSTTFKIRAGPNTGTNYTITFNGYVGSRLTGAIPHSSMIIIEIEP